MSTAERALVVALPAILRAIVPLLKELPNRSDRTHCFDLEDLPDRVVAGMRSGAPKRLQRVLLRCARRLIETDRSDKPVPHDKRVDRQALMRDLTGTWLGLYFLGAPFPHAWEPVARHAERHGYDGDGGIYKAAGDVYRSARRRWQSSAHRETVEPLMLLDRGPLAYLKLVEVANQPSADLSKTVSAVVRALGVCYEMLQLRLYIRSGAPIKHVILDGTLRGLVGKDPANVQNMVELATHAYGTLPPKSSGQAIIIVKHTHIGYDRLAQIPGCVLAPGEGEGDGVYRSRLESDSGRNGNRLVDPQLKLYRKTLGEALQVHDGVHEVGPNGDLSKYLAQPSAPERAAASGTPSSDSAPR